MTGTGTVPAKALTKARRGVVLLASGEMDKALLAFEIACGFQAMGMEMSMWFVLFGVNCLRKPRSRLSLSKWFGTLKGGAGRRPSTDVWPQYLVRGLNPEGAAHLPLSQLNFAGIGPLLLGAIMKRKGMARVEDLIAAARELGVSFTICQICVDAMAVCVPDDLLVEAEVKGVSAYYLDVAGAEYSVIL